MFEKYTEKARRVIFFARYEVSEHGSSAIETGHLLLGLLHEDKSLLSRFLPAEVPIEALRAQIESRISKGEKIPTSIEIPLSEESKSVLKYAAEESDDLSHKQIGTEHLLLGLLHEHNSLAAGVLQEHGLNYSDVRKVVGDDSWPIR
jgi:ATP-dependent Clp protease ATP-binding subunit ClpC